MSRDFGSHPVSIQATGRFTGGLWVDPCVLKLAVGATVEEGCCIGRVRPWSVANEEELFHENDARANSRLCCRR